MKRYVLAGACAMILAGCQTTEQTATTLRGRWIGQPADAFFVRHGRPVSTFARDNGGKIHTWRGGERVSVTPSVVEVRPATPPASSATAPSRAPDWWRAQAGAGPTVRVQQGRRTEYVCEAQIVTNADGIIEAVTISRDTEWRGPRLLPLQRDSGQLDVSFQ